MHDTRKRPRCSIPKLCKKVGNRPVSSSFVWVWLWLTLCRQWSTYIRILQLIAVNLIHFGLYVYSFPCVLAVISGSNDCCHMFAAGGFAPLWRDRRLGSCQERGGSFRVLHVGGVGYPGCSSCQVSYGARCAGCFSRQVSHGASHCEMYWMFQLSGELWSGLRDVPELIAVPWAVAWDNSGSISSQLSCAKCHGSIGQFGEMYCIFQRFVSCGGDIQGPDFPVVQYVGMWSVLNVQKPSKNDTRIYYLCCEMSSISSSSYTYL